MRMSIFPPVAPTKNKYTELVEKYKKLDLPKDRLKYEMMVDLQKLSDEGTDNRLKMSKKFDKYHYWFKPKLLLPFMEFCRKKISNVIINKREDIPDEIYNKNAQIIWDTYEEAYLQYHYTFSKGTILDGLVKDGSLDLDARDELKQQGIETLTREKADELIKAGKLRITDAQKKAHVYWVPKMFVQFLEQVYLQDTAYRHLIDIFMFRLQENMNKQWNPEIKQQFPLYTVIYDNYLPYFIEWMKLTKQEGQIQLEVRNGMSRNPHIPDSEMERFSKHMEEQKKNEGKIIEARGSAILSRGSEGDNVGQAAGETPKAKEIPGNISGTASEGTKAV